jgi:hypothetical protein
MPDYLPLIVISIVVSNEFLNGIRDTAAFKILILKSNITHQLIKD